MKPVSSKLECTHFYSGDEVTFLFNVVETPVSAIVKNQSQWPKSPKNIYFCQWLKICMEQNIFEVTGTKIRSKYVLNISI